MYAKSKFIRLTGFSSMLRCLPMDINFWQCSLRHEHSTNHISLAFSQIISSSTIHSHDMSYFIYCELIRVDSLQQYDKKPNANIGLLLCLCSCKSRASTSLTMVLCKQSINILKFARLRLYIFTINLVRILYHISNAT